MIFNITPYAITGNFNATSEVSRTELIKNLKKKKKKTKPKKKKSIKKTKKRTTKARKK